MEYYEYDYPSYYNYNDFGYDVDPSIFTALGAILGAFLGFVLFIGLIITVLQIAGMWKVFSKAGEKGWKCLIPIYNLVILFKISGLSPWIVFGYLAGFIPIIGWIITFAISVYQCNSLAKSFGKDIGYTIGLLFLPTIFYLILGFGKSEYVGKETYNSSTTSYQSDGVVNISEKTNENSTSNQDNDNFNL